MSKIGLIRALVCKNNTTGFYEFCMVYGAVPFVRVHPIGTCREGYKKGGKPCRHKTEDEALDCYRKFEKDQMDRWLLLPENAVLKEHLDYKPKPKPKSNEN